MSARKYYFAHFAVAAGLYMVCGAILFLFKDRILSQYTSNDEIMRKCSLALNVIIIFLLVDSVKGVYKGTAKALGLYQVVIA